MLNDGGNAFPITSESFGSVKVMGGMSLRDYFAAKAMPIILASIEKDGDVEPNNGFEDVVATVSYKVADAMIKARDVQ